MPIRKVPILAIPLQIENYELNATHYIRRCIARQEQQKGKNEYLVERNVPTPVRCGGLEHRDQIRHPIQINPITNPLQILKNRLESENPKPHCRGGEAGHAHIGTNVNNNPIVSSFTPQLLQNLLNRNRDIGLPKRLAFEHSDNVLMGLIGKGSQVGERVEEGVSDALHNVGDHRVRLRAF